MSNPLDSSMKSLPQAISALLAQPSYTKLEKQRALWELGRVHTRLLQREYKKSSFGGNLLNIPDRIQEFFVELNFYANLGNSWHSILKAIGATRCPNILDLGSGHAPKVELGLFYLGYRGNVVALDANPRSLNQLGAFLELFKPTFKFTKLVSRIERPTTQKFSLVVCNHLIDDLIMYFHCGRSSKQLATLYVDEPRLRRLWSKILEADHESVVEFIARSLAQHVKRGGTLVVVQYKSYIERTLKLDQEYNYITKVTKGVVQSLASNFEFQELSNSVRNRVQSDLRLFSAKHLHVLRRRGVGKLRNNQI